MHYYYIYGMTIASDYILSDYLEIEKTSNPDITIIEEKEDSNFTQGVVKDPEPEIDCDFLYSWRKDLYVLYKPHNCVIKMESNHIIRYQLLDDYDEEYVKQLLLTNCIPLRRAIEGLISLHGSCVLFNNKAYIISGESGAGKSTFTTELLNKGAKFLADDICAITFQEETPIVHAALPERKLCADMAAQYNYDFTQLRRLNNIRKDKYLMEQTECFYKEDTELAGLIIIKPCDIPKERMYKIEGGDKLKMIISSLFMYEICNTEDRINVFGQCMKLAKQLPVYCLERPVNKDTTKELVACFNKALGIEQRIY